LVTVFLPGRESNQQKFELQETSAKSNNTKRRTKELVGR